MTRDQMALLAPGTIVEYCYITKKIPAHNTRQRWTVPARFLRPVWRGDARALIWTEYKHKTNFAIAVKPEKLIMA
jgi:hypothetical protein